MQTCSDGLFCVSGKDSLSGQHRSGADTAQKTEADMKEQPRDFSPGPKKGESVVEIALDRLKPFQDHPFKVCEDPEMQELKESIQQYGIMTPLIVRPRLDGNYEIISGHRRKNAAEKLGYYKVPVIIRVMKDEDAVICLVDSNLHRETILPSEKAAAYKMKNDALKRKTGKPTKYDCGQIDQKVQYRKTIEALGALGGDSAPPWWQNHLTAHNFVCVQIGIDIHKYLVDAVHMDVFFADVFQVDGIDLRADLLV